MNSYTGMGNLTRDPEVRTTGGGKSVVNFAVAINRKFKRGDETANEVVYLDCEAWDTGADLIGKNFRKGDPIIVQGSLKQDEWEDKATGQTRRKILCRVEKFHFIPSKPGGGGGRRRQDDEAGPNDVPAHSMAGDDGGDGIPF